MGVLLRQRSGRSNGTNRIVVSGSLKLDLAVWKFSWRPFQSLPVCAGDPWGRSQLPPLRCIPGPWGSLALSTACNRLRGALMNKSQHFARFKTRVSVLLFSQKIFVVVAATIALERSCFLNKLSWVRLWVCETLSWTL